jgi:hypothetical protein
MALLLLLLLLSIFGEKGTEKREKQITHGRHPASMIIVPAAACSNMHQY